MTPNDLQLLAIGKAVELQRILETLVEAPEFGEGSCPADALMHVRDAIEMLTPEPEGIGEERPDNPPGLRLVGGTEVLP